MADSSTKLVRAMLLASAGLLMACQQGVDIDVEQRGSEVEFAIREFSSSKGACVDALEVSLADGDDRASVWEVATADPDLCVGKFTYGRAPDGFAQTAPPVALVKGRTYVVGVSGTGLSGAKFFIVGDRDGLIGRD